MIIIYFKGKNFVPGALINFEAFKKLEILTEKGKTSKFGFKNNPVEKFSMAKLILEDNYQNNIDKLLFNIINLLKDEKDALITNNIKSITILILIKAENELNFSITKDLLSIHKSIHLELQFEIGAKLKEKKAIINKYVTLDSLSRANKGIVRQTVIKKRSNATKTTTSKKAIKTPGNFANKQKFQKFKLVTVKKK